MTGKLLDFVTYYICQDKHEQVRHLIKPMRNSVSKRIRADGYEPEWFRFIETDEIDELGTRRVIVRAVPYGFCEFDIEFKKS